MRSDPHRNRLHDQPRSVPGLHHARKRPKGDLRPGDRVRWWPGTFGDLYHGTVVAVIDGGYELILDLDKHQVDPGETRVAALASDVERIV